MKAIVRCRHERLAIIEDGSWITEHVREDGAWMHDNRPAEYRKRLRVECPDCGLNGVYWRGSKSLPKWLRRYIDELGI